jgi:DNA-binding protein Fis
LALVDWCTSNSAKNSPNRIQTRELAERVLALYWDQVRPYHPQGLTSLVLKQGNEPLILSIMTELRKNNRYDRTDLTAVKRAPEYQRAVHTIDRVPADQPIPRL